MKEIKSDSLYSALLKSLFVILSMFFVLALIVFSTYMYNTKGELLPFFKLTYKFYLPVGSAAFIIFTLYTPISFGVSRYFINAQKSKARFCDLFYLFRTPRRMLKAIFLTALKRFLVRLSRLAVLLIIFFVHISFFGLSAPNYYIVIEWSIAVFLFLLIKIRYILCKYVFICCPKLSVFRMLKIATGAARGNYFRFLGFYIRYVCAYILLFFSFGKLSNEDNRSFSSFAVKTVSDFCAHSNC